MSYMEQALSLAHRALGTTSPNPAVGAVLVKDGVVIGEGHTRPPGQAHAEIVALSQAGDAAAGAHLYVTLEPCCFHGRTPPCTQALIRARVSRVSAATLDPNPRVSGKGVKALEAAGITVDVGEREKDARRLKEAYFKFITTGRPFVTAKFAASLDGKIATRSGQSQWITGDEAQARSHELRRIVDAVAVGARTVKIDNPRLTARDPQGNPFSSQPMRIVIDGRGECPPESLVFSQPGRCILATHKIDPLARARFEDEGVEVLVLPQGQEGVDIAALLEVLGRRDVTHLLVEGGAALLGSFFDRGLVDKVVAFIAPAIIGGMQGLSAVGGQGAEMMKDILRLKDVEVERLGNDILIIGYP